MGGGECELLRAWWRLSLVRGPFGPDLFSRLRLERLSPQATALLHGALLSEVQGEFVLHDALRQAISHVWTERHPSQEDTHRLLAEHYRDRFQAERDSVQSLPYAMEAYHHASASADPAFLADIRPFFQDQLCIRGKALSLYAQRAPQNEDFARRFDDAANLFRQALAWDGEDDYANHYYAFNLDVRGREAKTVAEHYLKAIDLAPGNVWWHSRWISFLITRGRIPQAWSAWQDALAVLEQAYDRGDDFLYLHLHRWVAKLLLRSGQLDQATAVLDDVPEGVATEQPIFGALRQRLHSLREAQRNRTVFPARIPPSDWWNGPHLCAQRNAEGVAVTRWMPGRVAAVTEGTVSLIVAQPPDGDGEPRYGSWELPSAEFDCFSLDERSGAIHAGRFVEIAFYGDEQRPVIRVHREQSRQIDVIRIEFPDPNRYLRTRKWLH